MIVMFNGGGTVPFVIVSDCLRPSRLVFLAMSIGYCPLSSLIMPLLPGFIGG